MVPLSGPLPPDAQEEIRRALETYMRSASLSQSDVAEAIGQSPTYVNNLLTQAGTLPAATRERMLRDVNNWLEREERARAAQRPEEFVRVTVAPRLFAIVEQLMERADMAIAWGPAGIGKSITVEALASEYPTNIVTLRAGHDSRTNVKFVKQMFIACTGKRFRQLRTPPDLDDVVDKLRMPERVASRNVLIIDQAHELPAAAYRLLMELHDRARCSVLLVGTVDLKRNVASDEAPEFGQVSSRFGLRFDLAPGLSTRLPGSGKRAGKPFVTVADIRKLFAYSKLKLHPDAARMLADVCNLQRGTVRRASRLFYWAEKTALKAHADTVTVAHLEQANHLVERELGLPQPVDAPAAAVEAVG